MLRPLVGVAAVAVAVLTWTAPDETARATPPRASSVLPEGVERWVAGGLVPGPGLFRTLRPSSAARSSTGVCCEPGAYDHYRRTGRFPDGTMLALVDPAARRAGSRLPAPVGWPGGLLGRRDGGQGHGPFPGRVGLLRLRAAARRAHRPVHSRRSDAPGVTRNTPRETTSSCSSIPVFKPAESPTRISRLPSVRARRYAIRHHATSNRLP